MTVTVFGYCFFFSFDYVGMGSKLESDALCVHTDATWES